MKKYSDKEVLEMLERASYEMATVGYYGQKKGDTRMKTGFKVTVTSDSHHKSHIHIQEQTREKDKQLVCVSMIRAAYFAHDVWKDRFSEDQAKEFDTFLRSPYPDAQTISIKGVKYRITTYWEFAVYQWKLENQYTPDDLPLEIDEDGFVIFPEQPDYRLLNSIQIRS